MTRTSRLVSVVLSLLVVGGCAHDEPARSTASIGVTPSSPSAPPAATPAAASPAPVDARTPAEIAVAAELASRGIDAPITLRESVDVDGDGTEDAIFEAGTDVGCVIARNGGASVRVDVLPPPLGASPGVTRCLPALRTPTGVLLAVSADNGLPTMRQGVIQLFALASGAEPALTYQEMFPFLATWTFRVLDSGGIELTATNADPAVVPPAIHKRLGREASGRWVSMGCFVEQSSEHATESASCDITLPDSARERRVESQPPGPPVFAGPAVVLAPGQPPSNARGPRSWCVRFQDGRSAWVELPRVVTARCPQPPRGETAR